MGSPSDIDVAALALLQSQARAASTTLPTVGFTLESAIRAAENAERAALEAEIQIRRKEEELKREQADRVEAEKKLEWEAARADIMQDQLHEHARERAELEKRLDEVSRMHAEVVRDNEQIEEAADTPPAVAMDSAPAVEVGSVSPAEKERAAGELAPEEAPPVRTRETTSDSSDSSPRDSPPPLIAPPPSLDVLAGSQFDLVEAAREKARLGHMANDANDFSSAHDCFMEAYGLLPPGSPCARERATFLVSAGNMALKGGQADTARSHYTQVLASPTLDEKIRAKVVQKLGILKGAEMVRSCQGTMAETATMADTATMTDAGAAESSMGRTELICDVITSDAGTMTEASSQSNLPQIDAKPRTEQAPDTTTDVHTMTDAQAGVDLELAQGAGLASSRQEMVEDGAAEAHKRCLEEVIRMLCQLDAGARSLSEAVQSHLQARESEVSPRLNYTKSGVAMNVYKEPSFAIATSGHKEPSFAIATSGEDKATGDDDAAANTNGSSLRRGGSPDSIITTAELDDPDGLTLKLRARLESLMSLLGQSQDQLVSVTEDGKRMRFGSSTLPPVSLHSDTASAEDSDHSQEAPDEELERTLSYRPPSWIKAQ